MSIVNRNDIEFLLELDPVFSFIYEKYGEPPGWSRPPGFVSLCKIILEQQVSLSSARAHFLKLNSWVKDFSPANILVLNDEEMRQCQISRQKAKYLRCLAIAIVENRVDLETLSHLEEQEIRAQLKQIKGIGTWTTDIYLMFCLQRKDIFPIGDIAVVNTVKELTNAKTSEEIVFLAEKWKPLRSLGTYFFWHYYLRKRNRPIELL